MTKLFVPAQKQRGVETVFEVSSGTETSLGTIWVFQQFNSGRSQIEQVNKNKTKSTQAQKTGFKL